MKNKNFSNLFVNRKKCVIYIRVSSERQVQGFSLDGQKRELIEYAKAKGLEVAEIYVEEGKSGKSIEGRDEFQRMMSDVTKQDSEVGYILVYKLSRFGRNTRDILNVSAKYSCGFPDPQVSPIIVVDRYLDYFTTIMEDRLWQVLAKPVFRWWNRSGLSMNAARAA